MEMLTVIGAGLPRTGTTSVKAALERLGFGPCYHMLEILTHPEQVARWLPVVSGPVNWETVFEGYRSTQDWPASHFWRELADAYPEARVVLTVRDAHSWYPSLRTLMQRSAGAATEPDGSAAAPGSGATMERLHPVLNLIGRAHFGPDWSVGDDLTDEAAAVAAFHRHTAAVRAGVAPERLLVFDVREGWSPLCSFLDVPVPDEPFPRLNDSEWMKQALRRLRTEGRIPSPFGDT